MTKQVYINQEAVHTLAASLYDLLVEIKQANRTGIAVAVNDSVIPKTKWAGYPLQVGDKIMIITATQGG